MSRRAALVMGIAAVGLLAAIWYWSPGQSRRRLDRDIVLCRQKGGDIQQCLMGYGWREPIASDVRINELVDKMSRVRQGQ